MPGCPEVPAALTDPGVILMPRHQEPPRTKEAAEFRSGTEVEDEQDFLGQLAKKLAVTRKVAQRMLSRSLASGSASRRATSLIRLERAAAESEPEK